MIRDRLIGVAFGLIVFGHVEHFLWPVRAADRMHARLADVFRSLAALARVASRPREAGVDVDARRQLIAQQVTDVQGFIESSKFEAGADGRDAQLVERLTADAQTVFLVLLAIARDAETAALRPDAARGASVRADADVAEILEGLADRIRPGAAASVNDVDGSLAALRESISAQVVAIAETPGYAGTVALYRELEAAVSRVASGDGLPAPAENRDP